MQPTIEQVHNQYAANLEGLKVCLQRARKTGKYNGQTVEQWSSDVERFAAIVRMDNDTLRAFMDANIEALRRTGRPVDPRTFNKPAASLRVAFTVSKDGVTTNIMVDQYGNAPYGMPFDVEAKKEFYKSMGFTIH